MQRGLLPVYRCLRSSDLTSAPLGPSMDPSGRHLPSHQNPVGPYVPVAGVLFSLHRRDALNLYAIRRPHPAEKAAILGSGNM